MAPRLVALCGIGMIVVSVAAAEDLVANGSFDQHVAYWSLYFSDSGDTMNWDSEDSDGDPASGSVSVFDAVDSGAVFAAQCIPALGGNPYRFTGDMKIASGAGSTKILLQEFADVYCDTGVLANHSDISIAVGVWTPVDELANLDSSTRTVRLGGWFNNLGSGSATVKFDDITLESDSVIFFSHFEYNDLIRWDHWVP